jgi:hypothetical protein
VVARYRGCPGAAHIPSPLTEGRGFEGSRRSEPRILLLRYGSQARTQQAQPGRAPQAAASLIRIPVRRLSLRSESDSRLAGRAAGRVAPAWHGKPSPERSRVPTPAAPAPNGDRLHPPVGSVLRSQRRRVSRAARRRAGRFESPASDFHIGRFGAVTRAVRSWRGSPAREWAGRRRRTAADRGPRPRSGRARTPSGWDCGAAPRNTAGRGRGSG